MMMSLKYLRLRFMRNFEKLIWDSPEEQAPTRKKRGCPARSENKKAVVGASKHPWKRGRSQLHCQNRKFMT